MGETSLIFMGEPLSKPKEKLFYNAVATDQLRELSSRWASTMEDIIDNNRG